MAELLHGAAELHRAHFIAAFGAHCLQVRHSAGSDGPTGPSLTAQSIRARGDDEESCQHQMRQHREAHERVGRRHNG